LSQENARDLGKRDEKHASFDHQQVSILPIESLVQCAMPRKRFDIKDLAMNVKMIRKKLREKIEHSSQMKQVYNLQCIFDGHSK